MSSDEHIYWSDSPSESPAKRQKVTPARLQFSTNPALKATSPTKPTAAGPAFTTPTKGKSKAGFPTPQTGPANEESIPAQLDSLVEAIGQLRGVAVKQDRQLRAKRQENDAVRKSLKETKARVATLEAKVQSVVSSRRSLGRWS